MIEAYSRVPRSVVVFDCRSFAATIGSSLLYRPYGTIFANEIFSSGIILSESVHVPIFYILFV